MTMTITMTMTTCRAWRCRPSTRCCRSTCLVRSRPPACLRSRPPATWARCWATPRLRPSSPSWAGRPASTYSPAYPPCCGCRSGPAPSSRQIRPQRKGGMRSMGMGMGRIARWKRPRWLQVRQYSATVVSDTSYWTPITLIIRSWSVVVVVVLEGGSVCGAPAALLRAGLGDHRGAVRTVLGHDRCVRQTTGRSYLLTAMLMICYWFDGLG